MKRNEDNIIPSIKRMLGISDEYTPFDTEIIIHINSALMKLAQLGVGPTNGFTVTDYDQTWDDFDADNKKLGAIKTYVYLQVKMMFDPPTNSYLMDAMKQQADELGWRLNVQAEDGKKFDFMDGDSNEEI
jgi:hypothetical protein